MRGTPQNPFAYGGNPNGNVTGTAGTLCRDTSSGCLWVATGPGNSTWVLVGVKQIEAVFDYVGTVTASTSPPWHARFGTSIASVSADLGTFGSTLTFQVLVTGVALQVTVSTTLVDTVTMTGAHLGSIALVAPVTAPTTALLTPYTSLVTVEVVTAGSGNENLVVHVELTVL